MQPQDHPPHAIVITPPPAAASLSAGERFGFGALVCCVGLTQSALIAYLPVLAGRTGLSVSSLGMVTGFGMLAMLAGAPLAGFISDRTGRRTALAACSALFCLAQIMLAAIMSAALSGQMTPFRCLYLLLICRLLHGLATGGLIPVAQAWVADRTGASGRMAGLAALSAGFSSGRLLGPLVISLTLPFGLSLPLWVMALMPLPLSSFVLRGPAPNPRAAPERAAASAPRPAPWRNPGIRRLLFLAAGVNAVFGALHFVLGPLFQQRLAWSDQLTGTRLGWITAIMAALMLATQIAIIPRLARYPWQTLRAGAVLIWLAALCLALGRDIWTLAGGVCLLGQGVALCGPACSTAVSLAAGGRQGGAAGMLASVLTLGYAMGASAGSYLFTHGTAWPALAGLVILPVLFPLSWPVRERRAETGKLIEEPGQ